MGFCGQMAAIRPQKTIRGPWRPALPAITNCSGKHRHRINPELRVFGSPFSGHAIIIGLYALSYGQSTNVQWGDA